jgi:negative regulator of sigma E activity
MLTWAVVAMLSAGPATRPAPNGADLLRGMLTERNDITFTGTRVVRRFTAGPTGPAVQEAWHRVAHLDSRTWRVERLTGGPGSAVSSVTIQAGATSLAGTPSGTPWYETPPPPTGDEEVDLALVLRNYTAAVTGSAMVAGRPALEVRVRPRHPGRPALSLALDAETQFRLRLRRFSANGELESEYVYERIQYEAAIEPGAFRPPAGTAVVPLSRSGDRVAPAAAQNAVDFHLLLPEWLPEGFQPTAAVVSTYRVRDPASGQMAARSQLQMGYSDGVASISLFEAPAAAPKAGAPPYQATRQNRFWVVTGHRDGLSLTLVGEIGRDDLIQMLSSVQSSATASRVEKGE